MASRKVKFALRMERAITTLASAIEQLEMLGAVYVDSGYQPGGGDPVVVDDLTGYAITPEKLAGAVTFQRNLTKLLDGDTPTQAVYRTTINAVRGFERGQ